jgi:4-carboxymuconolactone decarboxylase
MAEKETPPTPISHVRAVAPKLSQISDDVLFGDVWERPQLSKRDRSLITCAVLTALYRTEQLPGHVTRALANGVTREELGEMITHVAFYAGWPCSVTAARVANELWSKEDGAKG